MHSGLDAVHVVEAEAVCCPELSSMYASLYSVKQLCYNDQAFYLLVRVGRLEALKVITCL